MNWKQAREAAERWIDSLQLGKIRGTSVDIHERGSTLALTGDDRVIVLRAAERVLKSRGATSVWMPD